MKKCLAIVLSVLMMITFSSVAFAEEETIELYIQMTVTMEDGVIVADLVDDQGGTVSTWPVSLEIDGMQVDTVTTDEYGTAVFDYPIPDDAQQIACVARDGEYDVYRFIGCTVYVDYAPTVESEWEEETTTDDAQTDDTTESAVATTSVLVATTTMEKKPANSTPMTTTVSGDLVAIGVAPDNALLSASQTTQSEYQSRARMWMSNTLYRSLVPTSSSTLQLQLSLNQDACQREDMLVAKTADPSYSDFADEDVKGFAMDLQIAYVDGSTVVPLEIEDGIYTIEMPVPALLKTSKKIAVSVCTSDGLSSLIEVKPSNGILSFTVQRFQTLTVIGFGNADLAFASFSQTPWLLVVIVAAGVLLIIGGILLFVFVTFRKKKASAVRVDGTLNTADAVRVSLDTEDDDVYVPVQPVGKNMQTVNAEAPAIQQPVIASVKTEAPVKHSPAPKSDSADDLDDLLDEILSDLDQQNT